MLQSACASHRPLSCHHALPVLLSSCRNWRYLPVHLCRLRYCACRLGATLHTVLAWHMTACGSIIPVRSRSQQRCGVPCISSPHTCRWEPECLGCLVQCPTLAGQAASSSSSSHVRPLVPAHYGLRIAADVDPLYQPLFLSCKTSCLNTDNPAQC